ncbi:hypothetical protein K7X08_009498 [Anisodus acutangulus]|uniref:Uncharacterized protein n=1 Tax=Anisodus acutangulus TaxID=402998 RepID=A0A9Q1MZH3_9SOLA|nr:hypothetical protein K7X08_009498 [Anisodus acutangulus]
MKAYAIALIVCGSVAAAIVLMTLYCIFKSGRKKKSHQPVTPNMIGASPAAPPPPPLQANRDVEKGEIKPKNNTTMRDGGMVILGAAAATVATTAVITSAYSGGGGGDGGGTGGGCGGSIIFLILGRLFKIIGKKRSHQANLHVERGGIARRNNTAMKHGGMANLGATAGGTSSWGGGGGC